MKLCYDSTEDSLRVVFCESGARREDLGEGVSVLYTEDGFLAELVLSEAVARAGGNPLRQIVLEGFSPGDKGGAILIVPRLLKQFNLLDERE